MTKNDSKDYSELYFLKNNFKKYGINAKYRVSNIVYKKLNTQNEFIFLHEFTPEALESELNFLNSYLSISKLTVAEINLIEYKIKLLSNLELYKRKVKIEKLLWKIKN